VNFFSLFVVVAGCRGLHTLILVLCVLFASDFCRGQNGMYVDLFARATKGNSYSSEIHPTLALYGSSFVPQLAMS